MRILTDRLSGQHPSPEELELGAFSKEPNPAVGIVPVVGPTAVRFQRRRPSKPDEGDVCADRPATISRRVPRRLRGLALRPARPSRRHPARVRPLRPLLHLFEGLRRLGARVTRAGGPGRRRAALRLHRSGEQRGRLRQYELLPRVWERSSRPGRPRWSSAAGASASAASSCETSRALVRLSRRPPPISSSKARASPRSWTRSPRQGRAPPRARKPSPSRRCTI